MNYILADEPTRPILRPFTLTKPIAELRIGIRTIREKWEHYLGAKTSTATHDYLQAKYPLVLQEVNAFIDSAVIPSQYIADQVKALQVGEQLWDADERMVIAICLTKAEAAQFMPNPVDYVVSSSDTTVKKIAADEPVFELENTWDLFQQNGKALLLDFEALTAGRQSAKLHESNTIIGDNIFVEEGAKVTAAILNSETGPIYIGKNAEIMEGSMVRGPFAMCESAVLKLGAKVYGPTTIGPHSKVGGEVNNVVIMGYSNKGHDGFVGNSVIGEWCNLGADTNTSNLKNNYGEVRVWDYSEQTMVNSGAQFVGLSMGDHSKCSINTMFNTGTVVGVCANIFGGDFPPKFIPSYSWGGANGMETYNLDKAFEVAERVMERRSIPLTANDKAILTAVFEMTARHRS
jgi:UDP-N-acetylglucosamine diphosphorylase/glucosamine-1-phosphate N-acetyltransferase